MVPSADPAPLSPELGLTDESRRRAIAFVLLAVFAVMATRIAWVGDDSFITMRTVENFVHGFGLTWNPGDRVQSFTHPLWLFVITALYFVTGAPYYTLIILSLFFSILAVAIVIYGFSESPHQAALALVALLFSTAFMDYTTSGLENPLTFFLIAVYLYIFLRRESNGSRLVVLSILAGLICLNRLDTCLLILPSYILVLWQMRWKKALVALVIGTLPFTLWEVFSIVYFGYPFPNTYYAKLYTGIGSSRLMEQGFFYFIDSITRDPITLMIILVALLLSVVGRRPKVLTVALGVMLYLVYVLRIGGDFMSGRFFAAPFLIAVILLVSLPLTFSLAGRLAPIIVAFLLGVVGARANVFTGYTYGSGSHEGEIRSNGICDERGFYFYRTGLTNIFGSQDNPPYDFTATEKSIASEPNYALVEPGVGFYGFGAHQSKYVIDEMALADPLLSRLPIPNLVTWRIGHFAREIPAGYRLSRETGQNRINHPSLASVYDDILLITKGPIFSGKRWAAIWRMNMHRNDSLIQDYFRSPLYVEYSQVSTPVPPGTPWDDRSTRRVSKSGLDIGLKQIRHDTLIETSVDDNDDYDFFFRENANVIGSVLVARNPLPESGMRIDTISVPSDCAGHGYNMLTVKAVAGDGKYSFGHIRFLEEPSKATDGRD